MNMDHKNSTKSRTVVIESTNYCEISQSMGNNKSVLSRE